MRWKITEIVALYLHMCMHMSVYNLTGKTHSLWHQIFHCSCPNTLSSELQFCSLFGQTIYASKYRGITLNWSYIYIWMSSQFKGHMSTMLFSLSNVSLMQFSAIKVWISKANFYPRKRCVDNLAKINYFRRTRVVD